MTLTIRKIAATGSSTGMAFLHGRCVAVEMPTYPSSPEGEELRRFRSAADFSLREAAKRLGMSAADLSAIETGSAVFTDPSMWNEARRVLTREPEVRDA